LQECILGGARLRDPESTAFQELGVPIAGLLIVFHEQHERFLLHALLLAVPITTIRRTHFWSREVGGEI
jgi:hypothetical protein